jgi:DNA modification methylase
MTAPNWTNEERTLGQLSEWPNNPRYSTSEDASAIVESFGEWGQTQPLLIDPDNKLIDGHQRLKALIAKYGAGFVVQVRVSDRRFTEKQRRKFVADTHLKATGKWDWPKIAAWDDGETDLADWGFDAKKLATWNTDANNLKEMIAAREAEAGDGDAEPQTDRAEELREKWATERGQLWAIGDHRLLCGDSTDAGDVGRVMGGEKADLIWADPPFGINYTGHGSSVDGKANKFIAIANDDKILSGWFIPARALYLKTTWKTLAEWENEAAKFGPVKSKIVWDKCSHVAGDVMGGYATQSEIIIYCAIDGATTNKFDTDVWRIERATTGSPENRTGHPFESPVKLPARAIENSTAPGAIVYDPFGGSGTTMVACQNLGRVCRMVELSPAYCAVILERMITAFPDLDIHLLE